MTDIIVKGQASPRAKDKELVECIVIGSAHFQREPDPENPDAEPRNWPVVKYPKGSRVMVTRRTLRDSNGNLRDINATTGKMGPVTLTDVSGIGRSMAKALTAASISNLTALSKATARAVATAANVSEKKAQEFIDEAKLLLDQEAEERERTGQEYSQMDSMKRGIPDAKGNIQRAVVPDAASKSLARTARGGEHMDAIGPDEVLGGEGGHIGQNSATAQVSANQGRSTAKVSSRMEDTPMGQRQ